MARALVRRRLPDDPERDATAEAGAPHGHRRPPSLNPDNASAMQQMVGNAAVARMVAEGRALGLSVTPEAVEPEFEPNEDVGAKAAPDGGPVAGDEAAEAEPAADGGPGATGEDKEGEEEFHGAHEHSHGPEAAGSVNLDESQKNEFGELDGELKSNVKACLFVDGGRVGEGIVHWGGGNGGMGQQNVGDITLVAPQYGGSEPQGMMPAKAWVLPNSGSATVTRSFTGVVAGANGTYWFTARARARVDTHERLHVAASKALHDAHIAPLERRIAQYRQNTPMWGGSTADEAIRLLKAYINWNDTIKAFRDGDTAQNKPMGTVDTADLAAADFIRDYGARRVSGVRYDHYMDVPPGPVSPTKNRRGGRARAGAHRGGS